MFAFILIALFAAALGLASHLGWSVDTRDGLDWRSSSTDRRAV